jgi:hypothetical protein
LEVVILLIMMALFSESVNLMFDIILVHADDLR